MGNALALIQAEGHTSEDDKARIERLQKDLKDLYAQFQKLVFWEEQDGAKGVADLTDEEWTTQEKVRELKMKKLVTVAKSKFYMLKVNYAAIVEQVSDQTASSPEEETEEAPAAKLNINFEAQNAEEGVNVMEEAEDLDSPEQQAKRKEIYERDRVHKE